MADPLLDLIGVTPAAAPQQAGQQDPLLALVGASAAPAAAARAQAAPAAPPQSASFLGGVGNTLYGYAKGAADMVQGAGQAVLHGADALYDGLSSGPNQPPRGPAGQLLHNLSQQFDQHLAAQETEYQRATAGSVAAGSGRVAANVLPALAGGLGAAARPVATSLMGRMGVGALTGAAQGAISPVLSGNYGDEKPAQIMAGAAVGGALPGVVDLAGRALRPMIGAARGAFRGAPAPAQIDSTIDAALSENGLDLSKLPDPVAQGIRDDVTTALQTGGDVSPDALRRLADYRLTGATPTAASLTLDPAMVSQQKNLAKLGINSKDVAAQQLGQVENTNNRQLTAGLNGLGADTPDDAVASGQAIKSALADRDAAERIKIGNAYSAARDSDGRSLALDPAHFVSTADDALGYNLLRMKLPGDVKQMMAQVKDGSLPLTVDTAEEIKTRLGDLQRISTNGGEIKALGLVRTALDKTPLLDDGAGVGQDSIDAFNRARKLNATWMDVVDNTPALSAVRDGVEPDKFVQKFIVGSGAKSNIMDVAMLKNQIKDSPEAMGAVKGQITSFLKQQALNGAADEVGNFSQSGYNKALNGIGDRKLGLFFSSAEIAQMKAIGRVASYEQFQPKGSAVNNSNTASAGLSAVLDRIGSSSLLSKVPLVGKALQEPAQNIALGMQAKKAMNAAGALSTGQAPFRPLPSGYTASPVGPITTQMPDDLRRRGLLDQ